MREPAAGSNQSKEYCPGDPANVQRVGHGGKEPEIRATMVTFPPGMRTFWHLHTQGQVLHVLEGKGWVQRGSDAPEPVAVGDIIRIAPCQRHWHGATATDSLRHLAVTAGTSEWEKGCPTLPDGPGSDEVTQR
jgi:quercetin dioxygenase-like cupin family protein